MTAKEKAKEEVIKISKEIDRILKSGIEIYPNSPIHEKLHQKLNECELCIHCGINNRHKESVYCLDCLYERKMQGY